MLRPIPIPSKALKALSGNTLWEELQEHYALSVRLFDIWQQARPTIDGQRWKEIDERMQHQLENAQKWQKICFDYFESFVKK